MFNKHRIEALSDGVFAIVMTLLILDIKPPIETGPGGLWPAMAHQGHEWISFLVTFIIASVFWVAQHRVFGLLQELHTESLVLSFTALGFVTILPFTTSLWGHHITDPLAFMFYFLNQFGVAFALALKLEFALRRGHIQSTMESDLTRLRLWLLCGVMGIAAVSTRVLPIQYIGVSALFIAIVARVLRARQKRKWERMEAHESPHPLPR